MLNEMFLLQLVLKTTVVLMFAWALTAAMRRRSAAARHRVWAAAIVGTLVLPLIILFGPVWSIRAPSWIAAANGTVNVSFTVPFSTRRSSEFATSRATVPRLLSESRPVPAVPIAWSLSRLAIALWSVVAAFRAQRLFLILVRASRIASRAPRISDSAWIQLAANAKGALRLSSDVVMTRADVRSPQTWGVWRFVVLLPVDAEHWSAERRRAVLVHELAHVRRRDCLLRVLAQIAAVVHWFNPLVHLAVRRLIAEQEKACDDLVLVAGRISARRYAKHLLAIVQQSSGPTLDRAMLAMAAESSLEDRMRSILDRTRHRDIPSRRGTVLGILGATAAALALGVLRLSATVETQDVRPHDNSTLEWSRYVEQPTREQIAGALNAALNDQNEEVRVTVGDALERIRKQPDGRIRVTSPCRGNCNVSEDTLWSSLWNLWATRGLYSPNAEIRKRTLVNDGIFFRETRSGVQALTQMLQDEDRGVRTWAAIRLDSVRSPDTVTGWIALLDDADASLRERAAISLGVVGDPRAVDPLTSTLLNDAESVVRRHAARALGFIASGGGD